MGGTLTKLSDTRWRYQTGNRVYYIRQVVAPNAGEWGYYLVDGGDGHTGVLTADSVEQVAVELREGRSEPPW